MLVLILLSLGFIQGPKEQYVANYFNDLSAFKSNNILSKQNEERDHYPYVVN